jgi:rare lipoprotein A
MIKTFLSSIVLIYISLTLSGQSATGIATYYDDKFDGRNTANGEVFDQSKLTAAHRNLPFGTKLKVTNLENNKSVIVRVNDRGPFVDSRLIDLTKSAAEALDFIIAGMAKVRIDVVSSEEVTVASEPNPSVKYKVDDKRVDFPGEYYELDIKYSHPTGFAVQVGSFTELANLLRMAQELRKIHGRNLIVQVTDVDGKKVHRLLVSGFDSRTAAESEASKLKNDFRDCFVVELK